MEIPHLSLMAARSSASLPQRLLSWPFRILLSLETRQTAHHDESKINTCSPVLKSRKYTLHPDKNNNCAQIMSLWAFMSGLYCVCDLPNGKTSPIDRFIGISRHTLSDRLESANKWLIDISSHPLAHSTSYYYRVCVRWTPLLNIAISPQPLWIYLYIAILVSYDITLICHIQKNIGALAAEGDKLEIALDLHNRIEK